MSSDYSALCRLHQQQYSEYRLSERLETGLTAGLPLFRSDLGHRCKRFSLKAGFPMSEKSQTVGDFAVSRPSQIFRL